MNVTALLLLLLTLLTGLVLGWLIARAGWAADRRTLTAERSAALAQVAAAERSGEQLLAQIEGRQSLEVLVAPLRDTLGKVEGRLHQMEAARAAAEASLAVQVDQVRITGEALRRETAALVTALRKPDVRGRWGELHLRRAVELAGLVERCDFELQAWAGGESLRPDMLVRLAGGKHVVVDAKVPLAAFLDAAEAVDDAVRSQRLAAHARQLRAHVDLLAAKAYWRHFSPTPEFVVLFVPGEAFLAQALDTDPSLLEYAAGRHVVLATPTTLIALLRTVAYAWSQAALADNAREVFELGRELYDRLGSLGGHVDQLGRALGNAVGAYNKAVGSLESRVFVSARRLHELRVVTEELPAPRAVQEGTRPLTAPELVGQELVGRADAPATAAGPDRAALHVLPTPLGRLEHTAGAAPD
jgi:DNA recombination protein RmuC